MKTIILTSNEQQALKKFVETLQNTIPHQIETLVLFGSKARGDSRQDSDVDVLVILRQEDRQLRRTLLKQAARLSLEYDTLLSPRVIGAARWEQMRGFSFYRNIQQEAAGLNLAEGNLVFEPADAVFDPGD